MTPAHAAFILRVLSVTAEHEARHELLWDVRGDTVGFAIICNDLFWWGSADAEALLPSNVELLDQSYRDCAAVDAVLLYAGGTLFACRSRKMRPQGAAYPKDARLWPLLDACGPERAVHLMNPKAHPGAER